MTGTQNTQNRMKPRAARAPSKRTFHSTGVIDTIKDSVKDEFSSLKTIKSQKKKTPFPYATVFTAVVCTLLLMLIVSSYVQMSHLQKDINTMKREMTSLEKTEDKLDSALDEKYALIENKAQDLGMIAAKTNQTVYLQAENEDDAGAVQNQNIVKTAFSSLFSSIGNGFTRFIEFID